MDFERFVDRNGRRVPTEPFVTIQRSGRVMTINRAAYEMLGSPEAVEMLYSKKDRVIGLREVSKKEPFAFPLRSQGRKGAQPSNYLVAAQAFTKHYGIDTSVAMRYPAEMKDDILTVALARGAARSRAKKEED